MAEEERNKAAEELEKREKDIKDSEYGLIHSCLLQDFI